jgi:autotransporter-associated beta strand protein
MRIIGNNSFRGWVDVGEGTLTVANGTALGAATFTGGTYVFNAGVLQLEGGVTVEGESLVLNGAAVPAVEGVFGESYWSGPVSLLRDSTVGAAPNSLLRFGGGEHNTYSGETFVNEGILLMSKPTAITAIPGSLSIGSPAGLPAVAANLTSYQVIGNIFVNRNGLLNLNGQVENVDHLWLMEGGDVQTTTGVLSVKTGGSIQVFPGAVNDPATISGILEFLAGAHNLNVAASTASTGGPDLDIPALVTSVGETITLQKLNNGRVRLSANNDYTGATVVNAGILQVDGSQPSSSVMVHGGAQLMGIGRVGNVEFVSSGGVPGVVSPGRSPGVLSCSSFNPGGVVGTLRIELNGRIAGIAGHDQLYVRSAIGVVSLANVTLDASLNFASAVDDQFRIIRKDGFQPVFGEFNGLPEGANFYIGGEQFTITYAGGDGNDVVLTRLPTPPKPALTIERAVPGFVRLLWPSGTISDGYNLQSTTNLNAGNWTAALPLPVVVGTNNVVTNSAAGGKRFYRLFHP